MQRFGNSLINSPGLASQQKGKVMQTVPISVGSHGLAVAPYCAIEAGHPTEDPPNIFLHSSLVSQRLASARPMLGYPKPSEEQHGSKWLYYLLLNRVRSCAPSTVGCKRRVVRHYTPCRQP